MRVITSIVAGPKGGGLRKSYLPFTTESHATVATNFQGLSSTWRIVDSNDPRSYGL